MGMTRQELFTKMSSKELSEWQTYAIIEPFGSPMDSYRFGVIAAIISSIFAKKSLSPADMLYDLEEERRFRLVNSPAQSIEHMKSMIYAMAGKKQTKKKDK